MSLKKLFLHVVRVLSSPLVGRHTSSGSVSENMRKRRGASFSQVIILVLCFFYIQNKAQVYFNNRYDTFGSCDGAGIIDTFNNQYLTAGFTCASISFHALNLKLYNTLTGNEIISKTYQWGTNNFANANGIIKGQGKMLLSGTRFYKNDTSLVFQWVLDSNLDSVKYSEYGYLNKGNVVNKRLYDNNKYYYMVGQVYDNLYNSDILLIKTDTAGNEIWKKKIGVIGMDETGYCIKSSQDGSLIICGNKNTHNDYTNAGAYILKTDTSGSILWQQWFPTNYGTPANSLEELPNGDILVVSGKGYGFNSTTSQPYSRFQVIKLTTTGSLLFNKTYGNTEIATTFYSSMINKKNNLVAVGQKAYANSSVTGVVYEISQNGDSLLSKEFYNEFGSQNYFRDVIQSPDKGYCFAGFISPVFANGGTGTEDIWLLKVDSNFCESAIPCNNNVGINEFNNHEGFKIYPNPSTDILNIDIEPLYIGAITEITDPLGQIVLSQTLVIDNSKLNIENLKSGMYYLSIKTKDKMVTTKFIKK